MQIAIKKIVGKTIKGVVVKKRYDRTPMSQVFLVFTDDTYYEIFSSDGSLEMGGELYEGGMEQAREYMGEQSIIIDHHDDILIANDGGATNGVNHDT